MKEKELIKVGKYNSKFNEILGLDIKNFEIYRSKGLSSHMIKRNHFNCLKYIDYIPDIILKPDYIGVNRIKEFSVDTDTEEEEWYIISGKRI